MRFVLRIYALEKNHKTWILLVFAVISSYTICYWQKARKFRFKHLTNQNETSEKRSKLWLNGLNYSTDVRDMLK